ncbi:MAG: selenide, water dikinase SelD [Cypionkella sp.]|uniref:selenide, water dikinase SelD n=1 Tax=Cypionkella sp. TaxID=2811411 RepID=UPI002ABA4667|nr:selenide, water dikinase SelD [Cypionkella sp.]MDZ4309604.1 selenide, water dikinase SelD [Cypionkella sp.]
MVFPVAQGYQVPQATESAMQADFPANFPIVKDLVLVGGGHAHALVMRMWAMKPLSGVRLTLINPDPAAPYTGMLPGLIAGHYTRDEIMIDLVRLARFAGARLILDRVTGLDRETRRLHLADRPPLGYDLCSIDIGITSDLPDLPGFTQYAHAAKPLGDFATQWQAFVARTLPAPQVTVIGAGVGGVELALACKHRLPGAKVTLLEQGPTALPGLGRGARNALLAHLARADITLLTDAKPTAITPDAVTLTNGTQLQSDFTLSVVGSRPHAWLGETGLSLHNGFLTVSDSLQTSDPAIFAAGDCAHLGFAPRPKAGVYAVRAAPILLHNLRAALLEQPLKAFKPQRDYLKLISTGHKAAVADKWGLPLDGAWLWRWKDRIDRKFMAKFASYPPMHQPLPNPAIPGLRDLIDDKPLCGGCGAKLGASDLATALVALPKPQRAEVISGPGDDAAILRVPGGVQVITTDHLRSLTNDPRLMARIAAVHALGDIWAMGAAPQIALAQITLPRLSPEKAATMLAEIMAEAAEVFRTAGADIVGGHTAIGPELTIGFTVTGLAQRAITKSGAKPGDRLILTKPIGSGTIMAAEMAMAQIPGLILGEAVAVALHQMSQPNGPVAAILAPHAHAMTDVTGFGLAGHLLEILDASNTAALLHSDAIPTLPGALALAAAGQASSLAPANRAATIGRITGPETALKALLYDPQTAGGLLAAVPPDIAETLLSSIPGAVLIGEITAGPPRITLAD